MKTPALDWSTYGSAMKLVISGKKKKSLQSWTAQLDWPGPFVFLVQYLASTVCYKSDASTLRALAAFLLKVSLFNNRMVSQLPSVVAAAAYYMAVTMLEGAPWVRCYQTKPERNKTVLTDPDSRHEECVAAFVGRHLPGRAVAVLLLQGAQSACKRAGQE
jgi:hypothetical protein